ncbi:MAG: hypothetical protein EOP61_08045 [Sphingomonadales bacterium]|nr:MAG: hypothetical protein EOP61_08045 [Sphingomonadales bacterium]
MTAADPLGEAHARRRNVRFWHAFIWLLIGAIVYAVALALALLLYPDPKDALAPVVGPSLYLTPLFGLPYLLVSARQRGWLRRVVYFTVLLSFAHIVANDLAWGYGVAHFPLELDPGDYLHYLATGALGGFAGSVLAFVLLIWTRLAPFTPATRTIALVGVAALTALGALGMAQGLVMTDALAMPFKPSRFVFWFLCVHLPWQAAFAFFLAWLMRLRPA